MRGDVGTAVLDALPPAARPRPGASRLRYLGTGEGLSVISFLDLVGDDASTFWRARFASASLAWRPARQVVVGPDGAASACNRAARPIDNPLYCEFDDPPTVLLPVEWLELRAGPIGDFAFAFIVAHEWAHHVQNVSGLLAEQRRYPNRILEGHVELQADCLAGVWAFSVYERGRLEPGDIQEAVVLAASIADRGRTRLRDPGAHGTAKERLRWFRRGFETGRPSRCKTWTGTPPNPVR